MTHRAANIRDFRLYSDPPVFLEAMLDDIACAKHYIFLEIYKFWDDEIGHRFREALTQAAARGVKVKLLIDSWGATYGEEFFAELIARGGVVRFFRKIIITFDIFTKNHRRNHRKLLVIDDTISYIGSANISGYSLPWRESVLRLDGDITSMFKRSFLESFRIFNKYIFNKFWYKRSKFADGFELVEDMPSIYRQRVKLKVEKLVRKAKKEIIMETPYFLPGHVMRKCLQRAAARGVKVHIILPRHSDLRAIDLLASKYYLEYYKSKIRLHFYIPANLHAKLLLIDGEIFGLGSPNFDYRSFRYQHEVMLFGTHKGIAYEVRRHIDETLENSEEFDHDSWIRRPIIDRILGWVLLPFRHVF